MKKLISYIILLMIVIAGCKEKYLPSTANPPTGYLVVEGFISSGQTPTIINLSRTTRLVDSVNILYENNAVVNIEGENNEIFPLNENGNGNGTYVSLSLLLNDNEKYRLRIRTENQKEYVSDFVALKHTPAIDTLSWQRENGGIRIYVNTHDPQNHTKYYQWKYEETWEVHSAFSAVLKYVYDPVTNNLLGVDYINGGTHDPDTTIAKCWPAAISKNILTGTSEKLSVDVIYLPLAFIEPFSEKLSVLYSINVKQFALSHEAYLFYEKIKKNTEQLGSIFDPQPSELQGNVHCISNPLETVVGYVDVSEEKQQRIFISNADVPDWHYQPGCSIVKIDNKPDSINKYGAGLKPTVPVTVANASIIDFLAARDFCVDCRLRGTNIKPGFWP